MKELSKDIALSRESSTMQRLKIEGIPAKKKAAQLIIKEKRAKVSASTYIDIIKHSGSYLRISWIFFLILFSNFLYFLYQAILVFWSTYKAGEDKRDILIAVTVIILLIYYSQYVKFYGMFTSGINVGTNIHKKMIKRVVHSP